MECTHFPAGRGGGYGPTAGLTNVDTRGPVSEPGPLASHKHSELGSQEGKASPVRLSRKRMPLSSWAVMVRGWFG